MSKREIGFVSGGNLFKEIGKVVQQLNKAADKSIKQVGEAAREVRDDFQAGRQAVRNEKKEVPKVDSQVPAPADCNIAPTDSSPN